MKTIEELASEFVRGILANPNYNFSGPIKAAKDAWAHAEAFVAVCEAKAPIVLKAVEDAGIKAWNDPIPVPTAPVTPVVEAPADPEAPPVVENAPVEAPVVPQAEG